jgi:hypothetical protein
MSNLIVILGYMNKLNTICNRQGWKLEKDNPVQSGPKHLPVWTGHVFGKALTQLLILFS